MYYVTSSLFSVTSIDGNVFFWTSIILLRFLKKEISKMLITKIYQILFSIIQRRYYCNKEAHCIFICISWHGMEKMSTSSPVSFFSPLYCRCLKFKTLDMLRKEYITLNTPSQQDNQCVLWIQDLSSPLWQSLNDSYSIRTRRQKIIPFYKIYLGLFKFQNSRPYGILWFDLKS